MSGKRDPVVKLDALKSSFDETLPSTKRYKIVK